MDQKKKEEKRKVDIFEKYKFLKIKNWSSKEYFIFFIKYIINLYVSYSVLLLCLVVFISFENNKLDKYIVALLGGIC
ncbi:hypothetical protein PFBG_02877 [Plasmodium falciparum 7G8]|uniref:Uncharacterized protein n=2 Tax=Plasmodium falciparum TaxID=5833 RepID=W7F775_PLAF8|nr:hypothetical protein PFNF135_02956 [Plasmodium falciparum NF135/5.C10]EUR71851.1 hypothetical protein PFBG_02877 [Plasmodium falciparum 7G8]